MVKSKDERNISGFYSILYDLGGGRMYHRPNHLKGCMKAIYSCFKKNNSKYDAKIFCPNSGNTGSHNIVELFKANGIEPSVHEMKPDLEQIGLAHYLGEINNKWVERALSLTRQNIRFEASNRLFSMSKELYHVFPNSKFIFLHRDGRDAVTSMIRKQADPSVRIRLETARRYNCALHGPDNEKDAFRKACHYWNNMNTRIADDLEGIPHIHLKFTDLVTGNIQHLEEFLEMEFMTRSIERTTSYGRKIEKDLPDFDNLNNEMKSNFYEICGPLMKRLGYLED